ncbi:MAG: hypothetical protein R3F49_25240 [Planctomycetota bacterium]
MTVTSVRASLVLALCAAPLTAQTTWVVDDTPGPGVDFPSISAALAIAGPFDLVDVRPGSYGPFTLQRATRIIGAPGVNVSGTSTVQGLGAGTWTFIADLALEQLIVVNAQGTVILDGLALSGQLEALRISNCSDVRANRVQAISASTDNQGAHVLISGSRAQLVHCEIVGNTSAGSNSGSFFNTAQVGLAIEGGAFVALDSCTIRGGRGGDDTNLFGTGQADVGGDACVVFGGGSLHCVESVVRGGDGGYSQFGGSSQDGAGGRGVIAEGGQHRAWNTTFQGGARGGVSLPYGQAIVLQNGATLDESRDLPSLTTSGTPLPSSPVSITLRAQAGANVHLFAARLPVVVPSAGSSLPQLIDVGRSVSLGIAPAAGSVSLPLTLGPWPRGTVLFLQGARTTPGNVELTSAAAVIVR